MANLNEEQTSVLHFYVQDVSAGPNPTAYEVAQASITPNSQSTFGLVLAIDHLITARPENDSEALGRVQGLVSFTDLKIPALTMSFSFVFTSGTYSGSTISIQGRNPYKEDVRELAVVGGTGLFRQAKGYALMTTHSLDQKTGNSVLEYEVHVTY